MGYSRHVGEDVNRPFSWETENEKKWRRENQRASAGRNMWKYGSFGLLHATLNELMYLFFDVGTTVASRVCGKPRQSTIIFIKNIPLNLINKKINVIN